MGGMGLRAVFICFQGCLDRLSRSRKDVWTGKPVGVHKPERIRNSNPRNRVVRVQFHGFLETGQGLLHAFRRTVVQVHPRLGGAAMSFQVLGRNMCQPQAFIRSDLVTQPFKELVGDLGLHAEIISRVQLPDIVVAPNLPAGAGFNQACIDSELSLSVVRHRPGTRATARSASNSSRAAVSFSWRMAS